MGEKACHIPDILGRGLDEKQKEQAQNFAATGIIRIHRYEGSTYSLRSLRPVGTCGSQNFHFTKGSYLNDNYTIFGILDPLPPCLHSGQIHNTKIMQPPLLHLHLSNPLPPASVGVIKYKPPM